MTTSQVGFESPHTKSVLETLRRMASGNRLRTSTVIDRVASRLHLTHVDIAEALRELHRRSCLDYQADSRGLPVSGYISLAPDVHTPTPHVLAWQEALEVAGFDGEAASILLSLSAKLTDMLSDDMISVAKAIHTLSVLDRSTFDDAGFNVSARHLMGGSKVLGQLSQRMLQALGIPSRMHNSSPRYVICAGPTNPQATLLIENPRAFENAVRSGLGHSVALVCTYGFGLSYLGQEWLHAEDFPEHDRPIVMTRAGTPPSLPELFAAKNVFLWADLDRSAFDIYKSLQRVIPHLRLSGIYKAMVPLLGEPASSHPYSILFDKNGQAQAAPMKAEPLNLAGDGSARALWGLCGERAVDQEAVLEPDILRLGVGAY